MHPPNAKRRCRLNDIIILLHRQPLGTGEIILSFKNTNFSVKEDVFRPLLRGFSTRRTPDNRRPILYHVMCFLQKARAKINRWVIKADNLLVDSQSERTLAH